MAEEPLRGSYAIKYYVCMHVRMYVCMYESIPFSIFQTHERTLEDETNGCDI